MAVPLKFHFPIEALTLNAGYVLAAVADHKADLSERIEEADITAATAALQSLQSDVGKQKSQIADTGVLTQQQNAQLKVVKDWMNRARKTAAKAFAGDDVKLHSEFQVGVECTNLGDCLQSAGIIAAACAKTQNVAPLKKQGWIAADTTAFTKAIGRLRATDTTQESAKTANTAATGDRNAVANTLYDSIIAFQNAANLRWPATDGANAPIRAEFRLGTFPPKPPGKGQKGGEPPPAGPKPPSA